jgi:hypothetical protein
MAGFSAVHFSKNNLVISWQPDGAHLHNPGVLNMALDDELGYKKAAADQPTITLRPLLEEGVKYSSFETVRLQPGKSVTFHSNAAPGTTVSYELIRIPNSGGHYHGGETSNPLAAGRCSPPSQTLNGPWPQNAPAVVTAPDVCGSVKYLSRFSAGTPAVIENLIEIMFESLLPIPQTTGIELKPPTSSHPSPYWADPPFITKLRELGEKYFAQRGKNIVITDASLPWGGRFDIEPEKTEWLPPHEEHRNGRQADIRLRGMTDADRKAFQEICLALGITTEIHSGNHWHIRLP